MDEHNITDVEDMSSNLISLSIGPMVKLVRHAGLKILCLVHLGSIPSRVTK